ncbi:MAG: hypothetical protein RLZZ445_1943 [Pseudomonadota bacterium]|jgi:hypothetical protein
MVLKSAGGGISFSACAYVFLGGRKCMIADGGRFGVHRHSREGVCALGFSDVEERRMRTIMGKSLAAPAVNRLIGIILATDCNTMNFIAREDLDAMTLANAQSSRISAEIREAMVAREAPVVRKTRRMAGVPVRPKTPAEVFYKQACGRPLSG